MGVWVCFVPNLGPGRKPLLCGGLLQEGLGKFCTETLPICNTVLFLKVQYSSRKLMHSRIL